MGRDIKLFVTPEAKKLGIEVVLAVITNANIVNKVGALEKHKKQVIERIKEADIIKNPILEAYRELYSNLPNHEDFMPPAEYLMKIIKKGKRLPNINSIVDSYNIVSAETLLSIGAHDLDKIKGDIVFRITEGNELFIPLDKNNLKK